MVRELTPPLISFLVRCLAATCRFRLDDRCGMASGKITRPVIWTFWHNRILGVTLAKDRYCHRRAGSALSSPSKDGAIVAGVMARFGIGSVRGSSSRRGAGAIRELVRVIEGGGDVAMTPDGPRGPVCRLAPGVIKLAQVTGAPVMPVFVSYSRAWRLKTWDRFYIPKPFSTIEVRFDPLYEVVGGVAASDGDGLEGERLRLERYLGEGGIPVDDGGCPEVI